MMSNSETPSETQELCSQDAALCWFPGGAEASEAPEGPGC